MNENNNVAHSRGFSLVEVVTAVGISGLILLGTSTLLTDVSKVESSQERMFWLSARRLEIQSVIRSQQGWATVTAANPQMSCFTDGSSCAAFASPQPLQIPMGLATPQPPAFGINNKGDFCNTFSATTGNAACAIGVQSTWEALCDNPACLHAQPKVNVRFQLNDQGTLQDLTSYALTVYKDPKLESLNEVCSGLGGFLSGVSCTIPALSGTCDPSNSSGTGATFPLGFDGDGAVICGRPNPGTCAGADVATGFNASGGVTCAPACL